MKSNMKRILALVLALTALMSVCCSGALAYAGEGTGGSSAGTCRIKVVTNGWPVNYIKLTATKQGWVGTSQISQSTWMTYAITVTTLSGRKPSQTTYTWWNLFGRSDIKIWLCPNSTYYVTLKPQQKTLPGRHAFWKISGSSGVNQAYLY